MNRFLISLAAVALLSSTVAAQTVYVCPKCGKQHTRQPTVATQVRVGPQPTARAGDGYPLEYVRPGYESIYQLCLNDCKFYAAGNRYPGRYGGHPPQNLRGGFAAGTGYNYDRNRPNHCLYRSRGRTLVARARLVTSSGRVWWSARYR